MFQFKQFSIVQEKSAMKVGTDGVLLGAWVPVHEKKNILDVGSGTGLIALMLAQRNLEANIDAIEIDDAASLEATFNFNKSPWSERLKLTKASFLDTTISQKYDLIVSNPPYFTDSFKEQASQRTLARHVGTLTFEVLLQRSFEFLTNQGMCAFIIPYKEESTFVALAESIGFYLKKRTRVKGREGIPYKRSLLYLSKEKCNCEEDELIVEIDRHVYTQDYINLTQPFYLKM